MPASVDTYFVVASPSPTPPYVALCQYYLDPACTQPVDANVPLSTSSVTAVCNFVQAPSSPLLLIGAIFKTLGKAPSLRPQNYTAAVPWSDNPELPAITVPMPVRLSDSVEVTTKGVVLMFSDKEQVESLYPSDDPQIKNDGPPPSGGV